MTEPNGNPYAGSFDRDKLILDHVPLLKHLVGRMSFEDAG
jgi:hypothetical protein